MTIGGVFGEAEVERCGRKAGALQEVALFLCRWIMKPAAAFGRGAAGFDFAQKVVGSRKRLSLRANREAAQQLVTRTSNRFPVLAVEEDTSPGIKAARHQRLVIAIEVAPGERRSLQEIDLRQLAELRLLSSARLDSHILLTVVLAGDGRLLERLRSDELSPLNSRMRVRLALERATPDELTELLVHALQQAGAVKLMTPELIATLADHAQGNPRALMNIAGELLAVAAQREARHIDEKLFLEMCATPPLPEPKTARPRR